jgi:regulator of sirC expression with transglutaminase-like and TPR domain
VRRFGADPRADEFGAALLVNRALAEGLDVASLDKRMQKLAAECSSPERPWEYLAELGFAGDRATYESIDNSRMDRVLDKRRGIPISLGVLLIHLARILGLTAVGINFPGHFLVRVGSQLVDPFGMFATSEADCLAGLGDAGAGVTPAEAFREASPLAVLLRMLNNLKYQFAREAQWHRGLEMLDLQVAVEPDNALLQVERSEMWWRLGGTVAAREALRKALELADGRDENVVKLVEQRLAELGPDTGQLH